MVAFISFLFTGTDVFAKYQVPTKVPMLISTMLENSKKEHFKTHRFWHRPVGYFTNFKFFLVLGEKECGGATFKSFECASEAAAPSFYQISFRRNTIIAEKCVMEKKFCCFAFCCGFIVGCDVA